MHKYLVLLFLILFACQPETPPQNTAQDNTNFTAKVIRIIDGDTVEILLNNEKKKVRLAHIDCPEKRGKQPFGAAAKKAVAQLCGNQTVQLISDGKTDRWGRIIAEIINQSGTNVNQEMVRLGMAWHFKKYSDSEIYAELERQARKNRVGLWQTPNPTPPWEWRKK